MSELIPIGNLVLVYQDEPQEVLGSGLIIPKSTQHPEDEGCTGTVAAVGAEVHDLEEGERVVFRQFGGWQVGADGKKCRMMKRDEILAVIEEKEDA